MINSHFRVSTVTNPLVLPPGSIMNTHGLVERDLLEVMSKDLNFTYELCLPRDVPQLGFALRNGTWTGVIGQLTKGEADLSFFLTPMTLARSQVVDQIFPVLSDNLAIMVPYPTVEHGISFTDSTSFTMVISSFLAATVIVTLLSWLVYRLKNEKKVKQGDLLFFMIAVALNQGGNLRSESTSFRLIYGSWLLALFVVINLYSGTLTSMMTTPTYKFLVDSVDDLVANEKIKPLILRGSPAYGDVTLSANIRMHLTFEYLMKFYMKPFIQTSTLTNLKQISNRLQRNPSSLLDRSDYVEALLSAPNQSDIVQKRAIGNDFKKMGYCRALTLDKFIQSRANGIILRKNSPYTPVFEKKSLLLHQSGIIHYFEKSSYYSSPYWACSTRELKSNGNRPTAIKLNQFWAIFIFLVIGCFTSFVLFLGEILYFSFKRPKRC